MRSHTSPIPNSYLPREGTDQGVNQSAYEGTEEDKILRKEQDIRTKTSIGETSKLAKATYVSRV